MSFAFGIENGQPYVEAVGKPKYTTKEYAALLYMLRHGHFNKLLYKMLQENMPEASIENILLELAQFEQVDFIPIISPLEINSDEGPNA